MAAIDDLNQLLEGLPGYPRLTESMKLAALNGALIPDPAGVWPGESGYVETHDVYWAALSLLGFLQAQPVVTQTGSEGTSVTVALPDWRGLMSHYRSMSVVYRASGSILTAVPIPDGPHVVRTDMSGRGSRYGDVDTDVG